MREVAVVLLTWQRLHNLRKSLEMLFKQDYKEFDVFVSNGNLSQSDVVEKQVQRYIDKGLSVQLAHDGNDLFTFRRFSVGKRLASLGYKIVLFIDDDVSFPETYINHCLNQYEPKTYKSGFAWEFTQNGSNYYKYRKRLYNNKRKVHYCGTAVSMIDASIFLDNGLIDTAPEVALKIEDLWLSFYANKVLGWKLMYMEVPGISIAGSDNVALFKELLQTKENKAYFLRQLVEMGWVLDQD